MATKHITWLRTATIRLARIHFLLMFLYGGSIILFDSSHLMAPEIITKRAVTISTALVISTVAWTLAHKHVENSAYYKWIVYSLIVMDLVVAGLSVFWDRGVASREVVLFAVPIISAAVLVNRTIIFATAALSVATYVAAVTRYDYLHPNELMNVELYGVTAIYSAMMFVFAAILWIVVRARK